MTSVEPALSGLRYPDGTTLLHRKVDPVPRAGGVPWNEIGSVVAWLVMLLLVLGVVATFVMAFVAAPGAAGGCGGG